MAVPTVAMRLIAAQWLPACMRAGTARSPHLAAGGSLGTHKLSLLRLREGLRLSRLCSWPGWTVAPALCTPLAALRLARPGLTLLQLPGVQTPLGLVLSPLAAPLLLLLLLDSGLLRPPMAWRWSGHILGLERPVLLCSVPAPSLHMLSLPGLPTLLLCTLLLLLLLLHRALLCGT